MKKQNAAANWFPRIVQIHDDGKGYFPQAEDWHRWVADVTLVYKNKGQSRKSLKFAEPASRRELVMHAIAREAKELGAVMVYMHRLWQPCSEDEIECYQKANQERKTQMKKAALILIAVLLAAMVCGGCSSTNIQTPTGWKVSLNRSALSTSFDVADLSVDPNGMVHIRFENFKSDAQRALEVAEKTIVTGGAAAGVALY